MATVLHEHGHDGVLREASARGDWFRAQVLAEAAAIGSDPDGQAEALALLNPFAPTGWDQCPSSA